MIEEESPDQVQRVVVSIDDQHLGEIDSLVEQLKGAGMLIDKVLDGLGMITGSVPDEQRTQMVVHIVGVASVERQITYRLPPPDSAIQ